MRSLCITVLATTAHAAAFWSQLQADSTQSTVPAARTGALSFPLSDGSFVVHGGCSSSCCYAPLSDAWRWSPPAAGASSWRNLTSSSSATPQGRLYHSGSPAADGFYMFGGSNVQTGVLNDLWHLQVSGAGNVTTTSWRQVPPPAGGPVPPARAGHSQVPVPSAAGAFDGSFLIYGGINLTDVQSDLWLYNATTSAWTLLDDGSGASTSARTSTGTSTGPGPRTQHDALTLTSAATGARWMVLVGGSDDMGNDHDDVWAWSLDTAAWYCLGASASASATASGAAAATWPAARHGHSIWTGTAPSVGAAAGAAGADAVSFYLFGGQLGTLSTSPFAGDLWLFKAVLPTITVTNGNASSSTGTTSSSCGGGGSFSLLQSGTTTPGPSQPVARALGAKALYYTPYYTQPPHGSSSGSGSSSSSGNTPVVYFGGFSGYQGGTNDMLHNDVWAFTPQ